ncbi:MAG: peptidylprolyl isomerase [Comamonadaceae bacterium CG1_02_60_18]|nr:MAG: peptidylprolyl isomerase [Comamonadaceae bacterium CG1_02_60_18]PIQ52549.1 MAG: peptidylprolyl isomerase [Comamonadaceae bacterium CG12_big_fil_rev_8_21_14_0_65_59_15]
MTTALATVAPGSFLTLHYRLAGPAGDVVNTFHAAPATLTLGTGALAPAIEARLIGLPEGTRTTLALAAGEAFGERSPSMMQWMARKELDDLGGGHDSYAVGEAIKFATPDGQGEFAGVIKEFRSDDKGDAVLIDFNHPLAGLPVTFEVHIIGVI